MLDLENVRAFVRAAELKNFTHAAAQLGLSKSRVSLRVAALEQALGVGLLQRSTRAVELTAAGEQFLERARRLLLDAEQVATMFASKATITGELRVDMPHNLAARVVIPRLPELTRAHPALRLHLASSDRLVDLVKEGYDCVLRVGQLRDSSLTARRVTVMTMANAASPSYLQTHGTPTSVAQLKSHKVVHYGGGVPCFDNGKHEIPMRCDLTVNSTDAYQAAAIAGYGIIQAPRFGLRERFQSGQLVEILPKNLAPALPVSLLYSKRNVSPALSTFMTWLAGVVGAGVGRVE